MVKVLFLGLLVAMMCGLVSAVPAPQLARSIRPEVFPSSPTIPSSLVIEDPATRSERSTNLSYITGTARKIQLFIKNRHLQLLSDGTVNGTTNASSAYTILQRMTVGTGKMKIQGVATCQFLCMDSCGLLYGSRIFGDECVFNEMIEHNYYNTYSSAKYSNERRSMYLALNGRGQPRKVFLRAHQQLGRLTSYTRVLVRSAPPERTDGPHPVRHHAHACSARPESPETSPEPTVEHIRCRGRKKRKKKKRKCPGGGACHKKQTHTNNRKFNQSRLNKKCESEDSEECQRVGGVTAKKRHKHNKFGYNRQTAGGAKKKKKKGPKNKKARGGSASTEMTVQVTTATTEETPPDEDYTVDSTTHWEWDESTAAPNESSTPFHD